MASSSVTMSGIGNKKRRKEIKGHTKNLKTLLEGFFFIFSLEKEKIKAMKTGGMRK